MSDITALKRLRIAARNTAKGRNLENHEECNLWLVIADEIQAEVDSRFIELPLDADGVPIRVGDTVEWLIKNGEYEVAAVGELVALKINDSGCVAIAPNMLRHVKPRTLEEVLEDYADKHYKLVRNGNGGMVADETRKAATEIRELLGDK